MAPPESGRPTGYLINSKTMTNEAIEKTLFDLKETITQTLMTPTHKAGWPFIIGFAVVSVFLAMISTFLGMVGLILTLWCMYFFRDPVRMVPQKKSLVLAPGDGRVTAVDYDVPLPAELRAQSGEGQAGEGQEGDDEGDRYTRISIFLSVFDVHVNRVPISGTVKKVIYRPGAFLNAGSERASIENERSAALIELGSGQHVAVVQIAGLIARRIISELKEGEAVTGGSRYGLIRFGSRMDVYLPDGTAPMVAIGQRAVGGETILAELGSAGEALAAEAV